MKADDRRRSWSRTIVVPALLALVAVSTGASTGRPMPSPGRGSGAQFPPIPSAAEDGPAGAAALIDVAPAVTPGPTVPPTPAMEGAPNGEAAPWPLARPGIVPRPGFVLRVPILMYHRIVPPSLAGDSLPGLVVPPALFAAQLGALRAAGWRTITVAALGADLEEGRIVPPRTFAISIDDGWADGVTYALPILRSYGDVATFYVIAGRLHDARFLSPADLGTLAEDGMEIGDHTLDHVDLARLDASALRAQIEGAARVIASVVGERPATLAYPFGRYDRAAEAELSAAGFSLAVTTRPGWVEDWTDRFAVPRVRVGASLGPAELVRELQGSALAS